MAHLLLCQFSTRQPTLFSLLLGKMDSTPPFVKVMCI